MSEQVLNICAVSLVVAMTIAAMLAIGILIYAFIKMLMEVRK